MFIIEGMSRGAISVGRGVAIDLSDYLFVCLPCKLCYVIKVQILGLLNTYQEFLSRDKS
jgi:hypothetical protein